MPLYEFVCPAGHSTEKRTTSYALVAIICDCGATAQRQSVNRVNFGGFAKTPQHQYDFHDDYRRFREASEGLDDAVSRVERDTGDKLNSPLFQHAKNKAAELVSKGVSVDDI